MKNTDTTPIIYDYERNPKAQRKRNEEREKNVKRK